MTENAEQVIIEETTGFQASSFLVLFFYPAEIDYTVHDFYLTLLIISAGLQKVKLSVQLNQ